jgi:high-affinity nickel permease
VTEREAGEADFNIPSRSRKIATFINLRHWNGKSKMSHYLLIPTRWIWSHCSVEEAASESQMHLLFLMFTLTWTEHVVKAELTRKYMSQYKKIILIQPTNSMGHSTCYEVQSSLGDHKIPLRRSLSSSEELLFNIQRLGTCIAFCVTKYKIL